MESFPSRIFDDVLFVDLARCIEDRLHGQLPTPGHYRISFESDAIRRRADVDAVCAALADWAIQVADALAIGSPSAAPNHVTWRPFTGAVSVALSRWPGHDGRVLAYRSVPVDLPLRRRERVATALARKCPKLKEAVPGGERVSVLVLESSDSALGYSESPGPLSRN